ncbi:MAG: DM13 domain-containing protein [Actinomycetota bacterium]|nr:DM13 domain-containing protein [Actinomycetota bacterium]
MTVDTGKATATRTWSPGAVLGLVVLTASAVFAANPSGVRDRLLGSAVAAPAAVAVSRNAGPGTPAAPVKSVLRSQPWWQGVRTLSGSGPTTVPAFTITGNALQWRAQWTCQTGHLRVVVPGRPQPVVDTGCPGPGVGYATTTGVTSLHVSAEGPWQIQVDQQVDVPLDQAPLPATTAPGAAPTSAGSFYRVDQVGTGTVTIYRLADGTYALRLGDFYVTPNTDLEVRLSSLPAPHSTLDYTSAPSARVAFLDVTAGSLNFVVPAGVDPTQYRSVVLWCDRLHSAYAAATLNPTP